MCVEDGDALFFNYHIAWICDLLHTRNTYKGRSGRLACLASPHSGRHFFDIKRRSLLRLSATYYVASNSMDFRVGNLKRSCQRCDSHSRRWYICSFIAKTIQRRVIPDSFMSGCAPRLRYPESERIPFSGLPKLLLSATPPYRTSYFYHFLIPGIFHPRGDGHRPLYVDQPRNTFTSIPIPLDISPRLGRSISTSDDTLCP